MKKVYTSQDPLTAGYMKGVLNSHGIGCFLKNEHLHGAVGELPPIACWPEIWVTDNGDYLRARELIESVLSEEEVEADWLCRRCGETVEGQFSQCWNCGYLY